MSDKKFRIALMIVLVPCMVATTITVAYTVHLHDNCSVIAFIANER